MNVRNETPHEVIIDIATFDKEDPRQAKHEKHTIAPGQIVAKVPDVLLKHPQWKTLTAPPVLDADGVVVTQGGPLRSIEI
jgi:hypothetical protein